jgi:hypothetical protein
MYTPLLPSFRLSNFMKKSVLLPTISVCAKYFKGGGGGGGGSLREQLQILFPPVTPPFLLPPP